MLVKGAPRSRWSRTYSSMQQSFVLQTSSHYTSWVIHCHLKYHYTQLWTMLATMIWNMRPVVTKRPFLNHIILFHISCIKCTVYPKKYAHGFCFAVLCCGYTLTDFPISIRLTSLALWQSNDCPSASKATLMNMDKYFMWIHYERLHNHNKAKHNKTVCIFLGIYCNSSAYLWFVIIAGKVAIIFTFTHYNDVIMCAMASQITSLTIVYSIV